MFLPALSADWMHFSVGLTIVPTCHAARSHLRASRARDRRIARPRVAILWMVPN